MIEEKGFRGALRRFARLFVRDWQLTLLLLIPTTYIIIFRYVPMYGAQIAFRDYRPRGGITGSEWVGFKWFERFFSDRHFSTVLKNTLSLSFYSMIAGFPLPIIFALMLNTLELPKFKKFTETVTYMPHFISTVVAVAMLNMVFSPINGLYAIFYHAFGGKGYPTDIRSLPQAFPHLYVWSGIWKGLGWSTIIYTAALSAVPEELHEAAKIDGASRWKRVLHVDLPHILPTACTMLILRMGSVMGIGFEKVYLMQSDLNLKTSEVISTFVYKTGLGSSGDFSYAAAVGLFESVVNCILLITVNWVSKSSAAAMWACSEEGAV